MFRILRFLSAGESHGPQLTAILDGLPAGIAIDPEEIATWMRRRQSGYGRGARMKIESDRVEFVGGVRFGRTTGAPVALVVPNRDHENWSETLSPFGNRSAGEPRALTRPRPGHADLVGMLKYRHEDARDVLERASARESAVRVAAGAVCAALLRHFDVRVFSHVLSIGGVDADVEGLSLEEIESRSRESVLGVADREERMRSAIDEASQRGDTLGGVFEVVVQGLPVGLGSCMAPDRRLDSRLAAAVVSIPAVKGCEFGPAFANARVPGSEVHDAIVPGSLGRSTNRAGGLEGGMTTGEPLTCRGAMKPISTLRTPLDSVDMRSGKGSAAGFERSDICAVPAAGVIAEAVVSLVLADALLESCGNDHVDQIRNVLAERSSQMKRRALGQTEPVKDE